MESGPGTGFLVADEAEDVIGKDRKGGVFGTLRQRPQGLTGILKRNQEIPGGAAGPGRAAVWQEEAGGGGVNPVSFHAPGFMAAMDADKDAKLTREEFMRTFQRGSTERDSPAGPGRRGQQ
jgi:hypothetical protein